MILNYDLDWTCNVFSTIWIWIRLNSIGMDLLQFAFGLDWIQLELKMCSVQFEFELDWIELNWTELNLNLSSDWIEFNWNVFTSICIWIWLNSNWTWNAFIYFNLNFNGSMDFKGLNWLKIKLQIGIKSTVMAVINWMSQQERHGYVMWQQVWRMATTFLSM